jgi:hypothetical protein
MIDLSNAIPLPWRLLCIVCALVAAAAGILAYGANRFHAGDAMGYSRGHAEAVAVQGQWDAEKARLNALALQQSNDVRKFEELRASNIQGALDAKEREAQRARADAADLRGQLASLRDSLATAATAADLPASSATGGTGAARGPDDAATLRQLLGACSGRYADVAEAADALRVQLSGVQGWVRAACVAPAGAQDNHQGATQ